MLASLLIAPLFMSVETWGLLPKAQDDPTTIVEAISAAIAAHNTDPDAHMASGASLDLHRVNDVLDHPVGAVLADKWTHSEAEFTTAFESLGGFPTTGSVTTLFPGVQILSTGSGTGHASSLIVDLENGNLIFFPGGDFLYQIIFSADTYSGGHARFNFGYGVTPNSKAGVGFSIDSDDAEFYTAEEDGTVIDTLSWPDFGDISNTYIVRIQHNSGDSFVSVYINGELLGTMDFTLTDSDSDIGGIQFYTSKGSTNDALINLKSLFFQVPLSS